MYHWQFGISTALETLTIQAYRVHATSKAWNSNLQSSLLSLSLFFAWFPLSLMWVHGENTLFMGQDPQISEEAGEFSMWLVPSSSVIQLFNHLFDYFTLCFHIILCWVLVLKSGLANLGAALSISLSYSPHAFSLGWCMKYSSSCSEACVPVSKELF